MRGRTSGHAEGEVGKDRGAAQDGRGNMRYCCTSSANWRGDASLEMADIRKSPARMRRAASNSNVMTRLLHP